MSVPLKNAAFWQNPSNIILVYQHQCTLSKLPKANPATQAHWFHQRTQFCSRKHQIKFSSDPHLSAVQPWPFVMYFLTFSWAELGPFTCLWSSFQILIFGMGKSKFSLATKTKLYQVFKEFIIFNKAWLCGSSHYFWTLILTMEWKYTIFRQTYQHNTFSALIGSLLWSSAMEDINLKSSTKLFLLVMSLRSIVFPDRLSLRQLLVLFTHSHNVVISSIASTINSRVPCACFYYQYQQWRHLLSSKLRCNSL